MHGLQTILHFQQKAQYLLLLVVSFVFTDIFGQEHMLFRDCNAPINIRVDDLLHRLTLKEKISLLGYDSPAIERLGIPAYNWWNEALHGIARGGEATVFPQAIGMAATFNAPMIQAVSTAISTEGRAKFNLISAKDNHLQYMGLSYWTPNINIFRDPRWGRGQETYGEDPFLTSTMGLSFVKGLQGDNPHYLKAAGCAKHFAVHSGPEAGRHTFNALVDEKDLRETYLYAFKKLVDGGVQSIMCAYNRLNNEPCCTNNRLLENILRDEWHFKGQVVTDCGALEDIWLRHKAIATNIEVAAAAVKAGVNMDCANVLQDDISKALDKGYLTEAAVDSALSKTLLTSIKLGFFDDNKTNPYRNYGIDSIHSNAHVALSRIVAQQSMVLLKNNGILPFQKGKFKSLMVVGPNASSLDALMGNYHGISQNMVTFAEGIVQAAGPQTSVQYDQGCDFNDTLHFGGIWAAQGSDATIVVLGLTPLIEGEEGDAFLSTSGGDKTSLSLPKAQIAYLKKLRASHSKPIVVVLTTGSALDITAIEPYADAIIIAWYPGEQGGNALADILFGKVSPSGHLPITFYNSLNDIPEYSNYNLKGRTYRYFQGKVQYPFGFGLSYSSFGYTWSQLPKNKYGLADTIHFTVAVQNVGNFNADDVVQAYIEYPDLNRMPIKELKAFKRISLSKDKSMEVSLDIPVQEIQKWDLEQHRWKLYKGKYRISIGENSSDIQLKSDFIIH